jgi:hypothetical protein
MDLSTSNNRCFILTFIFVSYRMSMRISVLRSVTVFSISELIWEIESAGIIRTTLICIVDMYVSPEFLLNGTPKIFNFAFL